MATKITFTGIGKIKLGFNKAAKGALKNKELQKSVGKEIVFQNQRLLRKGFNPDLDKGNSKSISQEWKERRKLIIDPKHKTYRSNGKANTSITGDLVDSLAFELMPGASIKFEYKGTHEPYRFVQVPKKDGSFRELKRTLDRIHNQDIADGLADLGYNMIGVSPSTAKKVTTIVVRFLRRKL